MRLAESPTDAATKRSKEKRSSQRAPARAPARGLERVGVDLIDLRQVVGGGSRSDPEPEPDPVPPSESSSAVGWLRAFAGGLPGLVLAANARTVAAADRAAALGWSAAAAAREVSQSHDLSRMGSGGVLAALEGIGPPAREPIRTDGDYARSRGLVLAEYDDTPVIKTRASWRDYLPAKPSGQEEAG